VGEWGLWDTHHRNGVWETLASLTAGLKQPVQDLRVMLVDALEATNTTSREVWKSFWSAQQRFFKLLCISMKVACQHLLPQWCPDTSCWVGSDLGERRTRRCCQIDVLCMILCFSSPTWRTLTSTPDTLLFLDRSPE